MKKLIVIFAVICAVAFAAKADAADYTPLGHGHVGLKIERINFTDSVIKSADVDKDFYLAAEFYQNVGPNFYVGGEVGYAGPSGSTTFLATRAHSKITYIPFELNAKYAIQGQNNLVVAIGGGLSLNYVKEKLIFPTVISSDTGYLLGFQAFMGLDYVQNNFYFGGELKLQITEDMGNSYDYTNFRYGLHAGLLF